MGAREFTIPHTTIEYLYESVTLLEASAGLDLTGTAVSMALVGAGAVPVPGDWKTANWWTDPGSGAVLARAMLGRDIPLAVGIFDAWLKIDLGDDQVPLRWFARLYVL